ncbi:homeobox-leucine zipper protein ATHB-15 isoform X4 [Abrus precatorius]|uniref:Homeobox-leucine zipper protein ATHB-15 isoform X4 n=1 Tax=Abrus precatorius TaxID=3816 RepID=A0A8B8KJE8_ABRPR|nr:homeobox-leucine zipper protein ATHB-15 isoform X4 [Abrus precatorius]
MAMSCKDGKQGLDNGKYVRYTPEQVEALERLYHDCPKPSSIRRQQLIRECPILSNIEPKQIKVWFQNRRCREKQRKEASRLQAVNRKLTAMNKLLMEENDRLQKQVSQLVYENGYFRQHTQNTTLATKDTSCESAVTSGQRSLTTQHPPRDASPAGLVGKSLLGLLLTMLSVKTWLFMFGLMKSCVIFPRLMSIAEETLAEFLSKATGTAVEWVQMPGMKVAEILKDRPSWFRDCRAVDVLNVLPTANGGTIELLYMQPWSVPEVLRPLYESSTVLAQKTTMVALRQLRQISHEVSQSNVTGWGRRPAALRALCQKLSRLIYSTGALFLLNFMESKFGISYPFPGRGFNEAINGFTDEGWSVMGNDGVDDVTVLVNSSPDKLMGLNLSFANGFPSVSNTVLCAKASMLLQNVPPAILLRFLREHRSEWADNNMDAYSAAAIKVGPCSLSGSRVGNFGGQVIHPLAHTIEHEEFLEVIKLEGIANSPEETIMPREMFLLQLCSGMDENAVGTCAELIFAPIDASFADDAPLLPSGFRIIPLDSGKEASNPNRTLDLASALDIGPAGNRTSNDYSGNSGCMRSVMTIAFEFAFESHMQEHVATMARQYVRSIISSVQRVALALSPSHLSSQAGLRTPLGTPEAQTLARWICNSYRCYLGVELLKSNNEGNESLLKSLWHHSDAILCCTLKALPVFTFANQAGLDMLETTLVALQDITLEKIFDDHGRKILCSEFPQIIQQVY